MELRERVDRDRAVGRLLKPTPRPAPQVERDESGLDCRRGVVVGPVADVRDLVSASPGKVDEALEEPRIRLSDSEARRARPSWWLAR